MPTTATQTLIVVVQKLIQNIGDTDGSLQAAIAALQTEEGAEHGAIDQLTTDLGALSDKVNGLAVGGAPFDPTSLEAEIDALTARVKALEDSAAADASAAGALPQDPLNPGPGSTAPSAFSIVAGALADANVEEFYTVQIGATGGVSPYLFSLLSGSLPDGLSMAAGGAISGTPTAVGDADVVIQAHDANNDQAQGDFTIAVVARPAEDPGPAPPLESAAAPTA